MPMNDSPSHEHCPCNSGLDYSQCCGVEGRTALNAEIVAYLKAGEIDTTPDLTAEMRSAIETISGNPDLFAARVNLFDEKAWFVKMSPAWYQQSVFLDPARIKGTCLVETDLPSLEQICDAIRWQPTSFIFHTAFCGSTLMSQALDQVFNCLCLREPELLGGILFYIRSKVSTEEKTVWFERLLNLMSRRYSPEQSVVIKANDYANPVMNDILEWKPEIPVLFMYTPLNEFIAGCLKADNRRNWIADRYNSIKSMLPDSLEAINKQKIDESSHGEMAAVYWSYNVSQFLKAVSSGAKNLKSLDFKDMLANPVEAIKVSGQLFDLKPLEVGEGSRSLEEKIDELFSVYSKNPKFTYSPQQRNDDIKKILDANKSELKAGEALSRKLLGDNYPDSKLPNDLLVN